MPALSLQFKFAIGTGTSTATSVAIPSTSVASDGSRMFKSTKEKGDGYFGSSDGLHTVTYTVTPNFIGTLTTQATLATDPVEADWFTITNSSVNYPSFPLLATTTTSYLNFNGNFVWVRAVVLRSSDNPNGSVQFINYNH
jgi:hypothetical protein